MSSEPVIANGVVRGLFAVSVMAAVKLDDCPPFEAYEIDNVGADRMLPAKSESVSGLVA